MKIALLHLSDIHIRDEAAPILQRPRHIASTLNGILPDLGAVVIVLSGDIAFQGDTSEYQLAATFIRSIREESRAVV